MDLKIFLVHEQADTKEASIRNSIHMNTEMDACAIFFVYPRNDQMSTSFYAASLAFYGDTYRQILYHLNCSSNQRWSSWTSWEKVLNLFLLFILFSSSISFVTLSAWQYDPSLTCWNKVLRNVLTLLFILFTIFIFIQSYLS